MRKIRHLLFIIIVSGLLVFAIILIVATLQKFTKTPIDKSKVSYGFSFAPHPYTAAGLDWKQSYTSLLDRFNWKWVRLSFYWNQMVDPSTSSGQVGELKLDDLTFQIEEAQKRNVSVVLNIGAKAPYHPEVYVPENLTKNLKFGDELGSDKKIKKALLEVDKQVVEKLATYSAITHWQVENEPFAGPKNNWTVGEQLLVEEISLVRTADPAKRPIILTHPGPFVWDKEWLKLIPLLNKQDVLAVNYFPKTRTPDVITINLFDRDLKIPWPDFLNIPVYIWGPISPNFENVRKTVVAHGNKLWIMEMQAEPYLSGFKEVRGKIFVFIPKDIEFSDKSIRKSGIDYIGFWGANWWLLSEKNGDSRWVETVEKVVGRR